MKRRRPVPLAAHWARVAARLRTSRRVMLFLDFDGTLAPTVPRPEMARLPVGTRQVLRRLARHPRIVVIVISGRRRADVRRRVGVVGIQYLGLYGGEDGRPFRVSRRVRQALDHVGAQLLQGFSRSPGVWVEDKRVSLTVHLREASTDVARHIRQQLRRRLRAFRSTLCLLENLRDVEVVPCSVGDKGQAVRRLLAGSKRRKALAVYFGDDLSDESAFEAVGRGVAVLVESAQSTHAHYTVAGTEHVVTWLVQIEAALGLNASRPDPDSRMRGGITPARA